MRPNRSFGGGWQLPAMESVAARLALGVVVGSVVYALTRGVLGGYLLLFPGRLFTELLLWQPLTYAFVENDPVGVIFSALILYSIGGALEADWGSRRLLQVAVGGTALAGVVTGLLGLVMGLPAYAGGSTLSLIIWVAYGLYVGRGQTNFWGMPVSGNTLALIGAGFVLLSSLFYGWVGQLPKLVALALIFAYMRGSSPRFLWLRFQQWRLQRVLRNRHLRVVQRERDRDSYLN